MGPSGTCRWWCLQVPAALVLPDGSGRVLGRCCLRLFGELMHCILSIVHTAATDHRWWREWKFVDVVPTKWVGFSWMVSNFLSVVGDAPIHESGQYSITLLVDAGQALLGSGGELHPAVCLG